MYILFILIIKTYLLFFGNSIWQKLLYVLSSTIHAPIHEQKYKYTKECQEIQRKIDQRNVGQHIFHEPLPIPKTSRVKVFFNIDIILSSAALISVKLFHLTSVRGLLSRRIQNLNNAVYSSIKSPLSNFIWTFLVLKVQSPTNKSEVS